MGRKNLLADLLDDKLTAVNEQPSGESSDNRRPSQPTLGSRGAVGAMSRSLEMLSAERDAAKALTEQLTTGQAVVEIDTGLIDASIVPDRLTGVDEKHPALVESIRANGQLVPVLLRPHPTGPGRFQIAYGHRRVRALAELGHPARAVVRDLSDEDLVVAQGKENGEREDLSFIERATYAAALEDRGFKREIIMAALSVDKTELSRLITVARACHGAWSMRSGQRRRPAAGAGWSWQSGWWVATTKRHWLTVWLVIASCVLLPMNGSRSHSSRSRLASPKLHGRRLGPMTTARKL